MYKTISEKVIFETSIKKSRFITYMYPANSIEQAKDLILGVRKEHPVATHHVPAYIVGDIKWASDDGEPAKTAGLPILNHLISSCINNACIVVVRYFGGIKLGTGGLVRAYSLCAKNVILNANLKTMCECIFAIWSYPYNLHSVILHSLKHIPNKIQKTDYQDQVYLSLVLEKDTYKSLFNDLKEKTNGVLTEKTNPVVVIHEKLVKNI